MIWLSLPFFINFWPCIIGYYCHMAIVSYYRQYYLGKRTYKISLIQINQSDIFKNQLFLSLCFHCTGQMILLESFSDVKSLYKSVSASSTLNNYNPGIQYWVLFTAIYTYTLFQSCWEENLGLCYIQNLRLLNSVIHWGEVRGDIKWNWRNCIYRALLKQLTSQEKSNLL